MEATANGTPLDENAQAVQAGLATHLRVKADLDDARREIAELKQEVAQNLVTLEGLRSFNNLLESRIAGAVAERDLAVAWRAKYETFFAMLAATMREFNGGGNAHRSDPA